MVAKRHHCIGEVVRVSAVRREPVGGAWTAKWAKDSLNRAVDITRSGSLPVTLSRAGAAYVCLSLVIVVSGTPARLLANR